MEQEGADKRREALPWSGLAVVNFYLHAREPFSYGEDFVHLALEAYRAYVAGCPRAAIIISGEALLRATYHKIAKLVGGETIAIPRKKGARSVDDQMYNLSDQCRDYDCGSLKSLSTEERFAAIQLALVFSVISKIAEPLNSEIYEL